MKSFEDFGSETIEPQEIIPSRNDMLDLQNSAEENLGGEVRTPQEVNIAPNDTMDLQNIAAVRDSIGKTERAEISTEDSSPVKIPEIKEPTKEIAVEQLERTREYIKEKIVNNRKITLENYKEIAENTLAEIRKNRMLAYEGVEDDIAFYMEIKVTALNEEIREANSNNPEKEKGRFEMDMRNAEWMDGIGDFVLENRDKPEVIKQFWKRFDQIFAASTFLDKKTGEKLKYGVLAQVAAMDLIGKLETSAREATRKNISIKIEKSTPEEDVLGKIDFWSVIECGDRQKKIPCQVKSLDIKNETNRKLEYVSYNIINFSTPNNQNLAYEYPGENKIAEYFKKNPGEAIFIILPRLGTQLIKENGTVREDVEKVFDKKAIGDPKFAEVFSV